MLSDNIGVNEAGRLTFAGYDTQALAAQYQTPLYLMDEERLRANCRLWRDSFQKAFGQNALALYASKACAFVRMYQIAAQEQLGIDVVSCGELYSAIKAGFPLERAYFHSNNKTDADVEFAIRHNVGYFVVDNWEELDVLNEYAGRAGKKQKFLLRLTPGIDPHTYEAVNTGKVDSKFGVAIETGQAEEIIRYALSLEHLTLSGFHCHVGSQVFDEDVYQRTIDIMLPFMAHIRARYGYVAEQLDLGGGYGVRYLESDPPLDLAARIDEVAAYFKQTAQRLDYPLPMFLMEPGRSIVADAGMTLYTVGMVKRITGYKNYVSIDGGMSDNPRYALYRAPYTVYHAQRPQEPAEMTADLVGRCCESDDIIQPNVQLPESTRRGDLIAVCTTGAYNYSMASNYNRVPRPPVVMLNRGGSYLAVQRETLEDLVRLDVL